MSESALFAEYEKSKKVIDDTNEPGGIDVRILAWKERMRIERAQLSRRYLPRDRAASEHGNLTEWTYLPSNGRPPNQAEYPRPTRMPERMGVPMMTMLCQVEHVVVNVGRQSIIPWRPENTRSPITTPSGIAVAQGENTLIGSTTVSHRVKLRPPIGGSGSV